MGEPWDGGEPSTRSAVAASQGGTVSEGGGLLLSCLRCGSALLAGSRRCPGCGRRLLLDVPLERAIALVGGGAILGLTAGLLVAAALAILVGPAVRPEEARPRSSAATSVPSPAAPEAATALAALEQVVVVNDRLAQAGSELADLLAGPGTDAAALATALRRIAADATMASDFVPRIGLWAPAAPLADDLAGLYDRVRSVARSGLAASLTNAPAYRDAAQEMVAVLRATGGLQGRIAQFVASSSPGDPDGTLAAPGATSAPPGG